MKVKELHPARLISIDKADSLRQAAKTLADDEIGALFVYNGSGAVGIFSERDLARAVADGVDLDDGQVGEYMTSAPVAVSPESTIGDAIAKMNEFEVRHLLVEDEEGPVTVISMRDILKLLGTDWPEL